MRSDRDVHPSVKARLERERARAVKKAKNSVTAARSEHGTSDQRVADALCELAHVYQKQSDFDAAHAAFREAMTIREQHPDDSSKRVATLRAAGRAYDACGQPGKAHELMSRAARLEAEAFGESPEVQSLEPEYNARQEFIEEMAGSAPNTFWTSVIGGSLVPFILGMIGLVILATGRVPMGNNVNPHVPMIVGGTVARLVGLVWLCAAAFAHFHFFWPNRNRPLCSYGKAIALAGGILFLFAALILLCMGPS